LGTVAAALQSGRRAVKIGVSGAQFSETAAELEGFSRSLWGLVPLAAAGGEFDDWSLYWRSISPLRAVSACSGPVARTSA
jgi:hypothetical protein